MKFSIIGAGRVGTATGFLLIEAGYELMGYSCATELSLREAKSFLGEIGYLYNADAAKEAEMIFITTPDSRIADVCNELVSAGLIDARNYVVHMSGVLGLSELESAARVGAKVFCAHPLQTFPNVSAAIASLPGSYFGITAKDNETIEFGKNIITDLNGIPIEIKDNDKPVYHAAACIASNYLVTLLDSVNQLGKDVGLGENSLSAYLPLIRTTLNNIERLGTKDALTGPISRGDTKTIQSHIEKLSEMSDDLLSIYKELGKRTVEIALKKGTIDESKASEIDELLSGH